MTELGSAYFPNLSADGKRIFFTRAAVGGGGTMIWTAIRADSSSAFTQLAVVPNVGADGFSNYATWVSRDGCRLYLHSNRPAAPGGGGTDLYVAERPK